MCVQLLMMMKERVRSLSCPFPSSKEEGAGVDGQPDNQAQTMIDDLSFVRLIFFPLE